MTNNSFEVRCTINHGKQVAIFFPMSVLEDFEHTVQSQDEKLMSKIVELFGEFSELDEIKKMTFQALLEERAGSLSSIDDMLKLLKGVRICTAFFEK